MGWKVYLTLAFATAAGVAIPAVISTNPEDAKILHALNRLTFGPRSGDVEQVRAVGLKKWIDLELHPDHTPENPVLEEKLKTLDTLAMTSDQLVRNYPPPQIVRQMVAGQVPFPSDPDRRLTIQKLVAR